MARSESPEKDGKQEKKGETGMTRNKSKKDMDDLKKEVSMV